MLQIWQGCPALRTLLYARNGHGAGYGADPESGDSFRIRIRFWVFRIKPDSVCMCHIIWLWNLLFI